MTVECRRLIYDEPNLIDQEKKYQNEDEDSKGVKLNMELQASKFFRFSKYKENISSH